MTEQGQGATDHVIGSPGDLAAWYPRRLRHGIAALARKDVLRYPGKKVPANGYGRCTGEGEIDLRARPAGMRLKFRGRTNALQIDDKEAGARRGGTAIDGLSGFQVFRTQEGEAGDAPRPWPQGGKGVADLPRRAAVSAPANS